MVNLNTKDFFYKIFNEIIVNDVYKISSYSSDYFDYIIDIGANVGMFSIFSRILFPKATIISIEPFFETYLHLKDNTKIFNNLHVKNMAYGENGKFMEYNKNIEVKHSESIMFQYAKTGVECTNLKSIFKAFNISKESSYMIKIDCEGGERYLLNDYPEETEIVKRSKQLNVEIHFPAKIKKPRFDNLPNWIEYNHWFKKTFSHKKLFYYNDYRKNGIGIYMAR